MHDVDAASLGRLGEELARVYLAACGFCCLAAGHRTRFGEIDLIVRRGGLVAFVEVKTRRGEGWGTPAAAVDRRKLARLRRLAAAWRQENAGVGADFRFDVVGITLLGDGRGCRIEHFAGCGAFAR